MCGRFCASSCFSPVQLDFIESYPTDWTRQLKSVILWAPKRQRCHVLHQDYKLLTECVLLIYIAHVNITCQTETSESNWISEIWNESCKPWIIQSLLSKSQEEWKWQNLWNYSLYYILLCWYLNESLKKI